MLQLTVECNIVSSEIIMDQPKHSIYYHKFVLYKLDNCIWPLYTHITKDHCVMGIYHSILFEEILLS